jgi:hypothetical protein
VKLNNVQLAQVHQVLLRNFDRDELRMLLRLQLDEDLDAIAGDDDLTTVVFNLVTWANRTDRVDDLVAGAVAANPTSADVGALATDYARWMQNPAPPASLPTLPAQEILGVEQPRRSRSWLVGLVAVAVAAVLALLLLRPFISPSPIEPAPVDPTLPALESPLAEIPLPQPSPPTPPPTSPPTATVATDVPASVEPSPTPGATDRPQPPRAPALTGSRDYTLFTEDSRLLTVRSGKAIPLEMRDLWSAPPGTPADCARAYVLVSWQVRDPYPGGSDLQVRRLIPRGSGQTEEVATGSRGRATFSYCDSVVLRNLDILDYRLEWRFVSALQN